MKLKIQNGILIVDILSVLLILSIILIPSTPARVILGLPFLLFFPGYTLVEALFVKKDGMSGIARVALSGGMSIAVVALIGFGLNYTTWGIRLEPVLYSVTAFIIITSVIALIRRALIHETDRFIAAYTFTWPGWGTSTFNKYLSIILIIVIFGALGVLGYTIAVPRTGERFSEFYILGLNGQAEDYPTGYVMNNGQVTQVTYGDGTIDISGGPGKITLGIVNHEEQTVIYSVTMTVDSEPVNIGYGGTDSSVLSPIQLQQGEKWEGEIGIAPQHTGDNQKVELQLFNGTDTTPEDSLNLWINVSQAQ